jgi:hypothetical protein
VGAGEGDLSEEADQVVSQRPVALGRAVEVSRRLSVYMDYDDDDVLILIMYMIIYHVQMIKCYILLRYLSP